MKVERALCLLLPLWLLSCVSSLRPALTAFDAANYPEADRALLAVDPQTLSASQQIRWCLYRGLTALAVGDSDAALPQLENVRQALARDPTLLDNEDQARLQAAWSSLGLMPGETPPG